MSGHSKWKTIKHKKVATDQKRGQLFSKLLNAVAIAAKSEPNPEFNPRLRTAIQKARESKVPQDNIDRAIKRRALSKNLEELIIEAYGPEGVAILIEAITDNKNRTIAEIKKILSDNNAKFAGSGSVRWAFDNKEGEWQAKFKQELTAATSQKLRELVGELAAHDDVQEVFTSASF